MINAAVVGLGRWGQTLVDSLGEGSDAIRFARAVARTPSKVEDYAAAKGMELGSDYDDVLSDAGIDAVVLATPHSIHCAQIVAAAAAGKHVFCEKPLTLNAAAAETAIRAVDKAGVIVRVWPLNYRETENWVRQKLRKEGFAADNEVVALIAQHVEGNLVAGVQELEKIVLVSDS